MGIFKKKQAVEKEPQYYTSATNATTLNYKVYYLGKVEKVLCFLVAFIIGAGVGYLFYGGIGKDEYGDPTTLTHVLNVVISVAAGFFAGKAFLPMRVEMVIKKRRKMLNEQFRDMLDGLTTSLGAGNNVIDSFTAVYQDLKIQYEEEAFILDELSIMLSGMHNNIPLEDIIYDFGKRSGIDDIMSFADVFKVCYKKGGNLKDVIRNTHEILSEKMEIHEDIETIVTANKNEQYLMIGMPIILVGMIKGISPEFGSNFATPSGIFSTTIAIICFAFAYKIGQAVLKIRV